MQARPFITSDWLICDQGQGRATIFQRFLAFFPPWIHLHSSIMKKGRHFVRIFLKFAYLYDHAGGGVHLKEERRDYLVDLSICIPLKGD